MICNFKVSAVLIIVLLLSPVLVVSAQDLHKLWDDRCVTCHGHAGEFSRKFLSVHNGKLQGRHHVDNLKLYLNNHYLSGHAVEPVYNMLLAQASNKPRFKNECSMCHKDAASFVRETLVFSDGVLVSRKLKTSVRDFLGGHRKLQPEDVDFYMKQLTRIAHETK